MEASLLWRDVERVQPRPLSSTEYSEVASELELDDALMLKVEFVVPRTIYPRKRTLAFWIPNAKRFRTVIQRAEQLGAQVRGCYAIKKDSLISLLFVESTDEE